MPSGLLEMTIAKRIKTHRACSTRSLVVCACHKWAEKVTEAEVVTPRPPSCGVSFRASSSWCAGVLGVEMTTLQKQ